MGTGKEDGLYACSVDACIGFWFNFWFFGE